MAVLWFLLSVASAEPQSSSPYFHPVIHFDWDLPLNSMNDFQVECRGAFCLPTDPLHVHHPAMEIQTLLEDHASATNLFCKMDCKIVHEKHN
jgi:hypothetical protein